jgi:hypothetical protein
MPILGIMASSRLSWEPAGAYDSLATVTVGVGGAASVSFTSIPSTYKHLQIRQIAKSTSTGGYILLRPNNDSTFTNFRWHYVAGDGATATASNGQSASLTGVVLNNSLVASSATSVFSASIVDILDYADTNKNKTFRTIEGWDQNGSGNIGLDSSLWLSTTAISSIVLVPSTASFAQYSSFALYGIK